MGRGHGGYGAHGGHGGHGSHGSLGRHGAGHGGDGTRRARACGGGVGARLGPARARANWDELVPVGTSWCPCTAAGVHHHTQDGRVGTRKSGIRPFANFSVVTDLRYFLYLGVSVTLSQLLTDHSTARAAVSCPAGDGTGP